MYQAVRAYKHEREAPCILDHGTRWSVVVVPLCLELGRDIPPHHMLCYTALVRFLELGGGKVKKKTKLILAPPCSHIVI